MPMSPTNSPSPDAVAADTWVIAADASEGARQRLAEAWRYRRIVWFFASRAILKMHAKTKLGWPWVLIRTLFPLLVGSFVYGSVMQVDSGPHPYFLFLLVGSIAWSFFDTPLTRASRGLEMNRALIRKLYLPRMILPLTQMAAGLIEPLDRKSV